jgi:hypothetical protein
MRAATRASSASRPLPHSLERRWIAAFLLIVVASGVVAAHSSLGLDYGNLSCHLNSEWCDEAGYPIQSLVHGDLKGFFAQQPLMGPVSLLLRAPFAALARIGTDELLDAYRLGVFACLVVSGLVALQVAGAMARRRRPPLQCALVAGLLFLNPAVFYATDFGHPEEFLTAALCVSSAVFAIERRWTPAALVLGLAVASKPWALLAALPIFLVVAPPARRQFVLVATLVTLVFYAPMIAGDPGRFKQVVQGAGELGSRPGTVTAANVWWFASAREASFPRFVAVRNGKVIARYETGYALPAWLAHLAHPLVLALAILLSVVWYRSPARARPETVLLLLAVILLLRCVLDPGNHSYYHAPAIAALLAYEGLSRRGVPWASLALMGALWATIRINAHVTPDQAFALAYLAWAIPAVIAGLWLLFRRSRVAVS